MAPSQAVPGTTAADLTGAVELIVTLGSRHATDLGACSGRSFTLPAAALPSPCPVLVVGTGQGARPTAAESALESPGAVTLASSTALASATVPFLLLVHQRGPPPVALLPVSHQVSADPNRRPRDGNHTLPIQPGRDRPAQGLDGEMDRRRLDLARQVPVRHRDLGYPMPVGPVPGIPRRLLRPAFPSLAEANGATTVEFDIQIDSHGVREDRVRGVPHTGEGLLGRPLAEMRITDLGTSSPLLDPENTGALAVFVFRPIPRRGLPQVPDMDLPEPGRDGRCGRPDRPGGAGDPRAVGPG